VNGIASFGGFCLCCNPKEYLLSAERFWRSPLLQYFLAFCFYLNSLRWLPVHLAGIMLYFIPLVALFLSWLFLDEQFTFLQVVGFIVTVLSVYFLNRKYSDE